MWGVRSGKTVSRLLARAAGWMEVRGDSRLHVASLSCGHGQSLLGFGEERREWNTPSRPISSCSVSCCVSSSPSPGGRRATARPVTGTVGSRQQLRSCRDTPSAPAWAPPHLRSLGSSPWRPGRGANVGKGKRLVFVEARQCMPSPDLDLLSSDVQKLKTPDAKQALAAWVLTCWGHSEPGTEPCVDGDVDGGPLSLAAPARPCPLPRSHLYQSARAGSRWPPAGCAFRPSLLPPTSFSECVCRW